MRSILHKSLKSFALIALLATPTASQPAFCDEPQLKAPTDWRRTFNDDFSLDLSQWTTRFPWGGRYTPGSKEAEIYVDEAYPALPLNPFSIEAGILTITANRLSPENAARFQGRRYTSGLLTSYPAFAQLYGYFEVRARLPRGRGLWPAFWLLPTDFTWPPEIDIEQVGDSTKLYVTVHYGTRRETGFAISVPDTSAAFHSYGMLWTPRFIAWYFDHDRVAFTPTPADMHSKRMYLLISLAVGGTWPGEPPVQTVFPAKLEVSDVHAYALPSQPFP
jgi:beta-glucanase (GH16 family)